MALGEAGARIVRVRLDELRSLAPSALDPSNVQALHDLRIAAKRLRYVLEVMSPCFGPYAATAAKRARDVQDLVGEIHDCDVQLPQVLSLVEELRSHDAAELRREAGDAKDLDPGLSGDAPHREEYRGLDVLAAHLRARRTLLFERFVALWEKLERDDFAGRLEAALGERPEPAAREAPPPAPAPAGDGGASHADALRSAVGRRTHRT